MTQPLALLLYEKLLPGTQIVNRLQDLGWRVQLLHAACDLRSAAQQHKPLIVIADLFATRGSVCDGIAELKKSEDTVHVPVIAFTSDAKLTQAATQAGATLVVGDAAILQHLDQFLDQALTEF
jgi:DNA-binding NarL/FixJ family response regulator